VRAGRPCDAPRRCVFDDRFLRLWCKHPQTIIPVDPRIGPSPYKICTACGRRILLTEEDHCNPPPSVPSRAEIVEINPLDPPPPRRRFGAYKGQFRVGPEFDEPLDAEDLEAWSEDSHDRSGDRTAPAHR
jgi:hypothetical protein